MTFDCALGYPGEGPPNPQPWTFYTRNIDSLQSYPAPFHYKSDLMMLQGTRISAFLLTGKPLDLRITSSGDLKIPHGGVAALSKHDRARPFAASDDCTNTWETLYDTGRVMAVWQQVLPKVRFLCFNVYLHAGTLPESKIANSKIIHDVFEICSRYVGVSRSSSKVVCRIIQ